MDNQEVSKDRKIETNLGALQIAMRAYGINWCNVDAFWVGRRASGRITERKIGPDSALYSIDKNDPVASFLNVEREAKA